MKASEFFMANYLYKYIGPDTWDFKNGGVYKSFGYRHEWNILETRHKTTVYKMFGPTVNGFADNHPNMVNVEKKFVLVRNKTHLPEWW